MPTGICELRTISTSSSVPKENARRAYQALLTLGPPLEDLESNDLLDHEANFRFCSDEDHIDILASIGAMPFARVWSNRVLEEVAGLSVPFISLEDLIADKPQVGRLRHVADAEELDQLSKLLP